DLGGELLLKTLRRWVAGEIEATAQDEEAATQAPRLTRPDGVIDWSDAAIDIWRKVRAFQPWPQATTRYDDQRFTVLEAWPLEAGVTAQIGDAVVGEVIGGGGVELSELLPGRVATAVVTCGTGSLALLRVQRAGRRAMEIEQYLNGDRGLIGARLG
ncbi:MAG: hypothetical protein QF664_10180, partial [Dehalococcoidia bacterium]|nr:hypothetical protein [Dehalococcoidia bacterium]